MPRSVASASPRRGALPIRFVADGLLAIDFSADAGPGAARFLRRPAETDWAKEADCKGAMNALGIDRAALRAVILEATAVESIGMSENEFARLQPQDFFQGSGQFG